MQAFGPSGLKYRGAGEPGLGDAAGRPALLLPGGRRGGAPARCQCRNALRCHDFRGTSAARSLFGTIENSRRQPAGLPGQI